MELFASLFQDLLLFVYHCFDRVVMHGYLSGLSRPEQVVHFFREVAGVPAITKEALSRGVFHSQEHGTGQHVSLQPAQVSHCRSQLPHPGPPAQPVHALLLLHPRRGLGADGDASCLILPLSGDLLPERPPLHRKGTEPGASDLPQERQRVSGGLQPRRLTGCRRPSSKPTSPRRTQRMPLRGNSLDEFSEALGNLSIRWRRRPPSRRPLSSSG